MKLNRLALTNWRNIEALDIPLEKINIFRGGNAQGKSSIRDGIEYLLTGRNDFTDARGEGAIKLIREGADKASLEADMQGQEVISIRATLTEKSGRTPKFAHKTDPTYPVENVKGWLEKQKPVLSCLLNSRYFIKLDAGDQKKLLASIILPESYEWPEEIKNKCNAVHIASLIPWDAAPFDVIEKAYEIAFGKRRDLNRDLKNLHVPEAIQPPAGYGDVEAVRTRLTQLRQQVSHLEGERRTGERARSEAESKQRVLEARIEGFEAAIGSEQRVLEGIDAKLLSAKQVKDLQVAAGNDKKLAKIEKDIAQLREQIAGVNALLKQFDALDGKNACPTCKRDVTDEWLTQAMSPHIDKKNNLMNEENNLLRQQKELGDVEGAKRKLEEQKQIAADEARAKSLVHEKNALLRASREELAGIVVPPLAIESESGISGQQEIRDIEAKLEEIAVADARAKEIIRTKDQQKKLTAAVFALDSLVTYFGKDGVKGELLKEHIGGFTSAMNESLAGWGYAVAFEIEPYGFRVTNLTKHTTHDVQLLSGSEKLRFAVAFQVALAQVSGIRMVVIDEVDIFDTAGKSAFASLLMSADLDQIIALGTDEREEVPEVEGIAFYAMREGKAVQLVAQEVA